MNDSAPTFNPEVFLNTQYSESNSTELLAVPEGEYIAVSDPVSAGNFRSYDIKKGDRAGSKGYALDINWVINDEGGKLKEFLGREPKVRQSVMLEIGRDGTLEFGPGRNVNLGRLREATDTNQKGRTFSFAMLGGKVARIKVKHRIDPTSGRTFVEVAEAVKAA